MQDKKDYSAFVTSLPALAPTIYAIESQAETDGQLIELWLHGRSCHTQRAYRRDIRRFQAFLPKSLAQVTLKDFQGFVDSLGCAITSKRRITASLKSLFSFAMKIGYIRYNVAAAVRAPKAMNRLAERILSETQVHAVIALTANRRDNLLLRVLYGSGVRVSELCALKWSDLQPNGDTGQLSVFGKGGKTRWIVLPAPLWRDLLELRNESPDSGPVFVSRKHAGHLDPSQILRIVRAAAKRAGVRKNVSPHWLRHCHASHALDRGAAINLVSATLGHSDISISGKYLHAKPNDSSAKYLAV